MGPSAIEILFVEDNPHEAELTIRSLKKSNLANTITHISDGELALDFIFSKYVGTPLHRSSIPALIILDLKPPKVDGLEILKRIKADDRTKMIPVVVLTSSKEEQDILKSYQLGANSYIVKPVNFESFSKTITDLGLYWAVLNQPPLV